jgi:hypothetical protein
LAKSYNIAWLYEYQEDANAVQMSCELVSLAPKLSPREYLRLHQTLKHHVRIDKPQFLVLKHPRQCADNLKPKLLPQPNRARVGSDDEVELHRTKTHLNRQLLRMLTHLRCNALALGFFGDDIATVTHMCAQAGLVGFDDVGADDAAILSAGYIRGGGELDPSFVDLCFGALGREGVGLASFDSGLQDGPEAWPVGGLEKADL